MAEKSPQDRRGPYYVDIGTVEIQPGIVGPALPMAAAQQRPVPPGQGVYIDNGTEADLLVRELREAIWEFTDAARMSAFHCGQASRTAAGVEDAQARSRVADRLQLTADKKLGHVLRKITEALEEQP